jgi:AcrR family transcriptional regulator
MVRMVFVYTELYSKEFDSSQMSSTAIRRYDSTRRQARAAASRRRVVEAAHDLFVEHGYSATSIAAIAKAADVSTPTVYAGFAGKADLLKQAIDFAIAGDLEPVALRDRPTAAWVFGATSAKELLGRYAVLMGEVGERAAPIYDVLVRAADVEVELADLLAEMELQRLRAATRVAKTVRDLGGLPRGRNVTWARDVIWVCNAPENYTMFVTRRGWSTRRYVEWATTSLVRLVLEAAC